MCRSKSVLGYFPLRYVYKSYDAAYQFLIPPDRMGPSLHWKAGPVRTPQNVPIGMHFLAAVHGQVARTFVERIGSAVRPAVMNQIVHALAQQIIGFFIAQYPQA